MAHPHATPPGPWLRIWGAALLSVGLAFTGLELFWRSRGHEPAIAADAALWCYHRERACGADGKTLVLVGSSRIQTGFVQEIFLEQYPDYQVVQLAVQAKGGFATLRDLAEDESFRGFVLCSVEPRTLQPGQLEAQQDFVDHFHNGWGPGEKLSLLLSVPLEENLVLLRPPLSGESLVVSLWNGRLPKSAFVSNRFDRTWYLDYSHADLDAVVRARASSFAAELKEHPPVPPEQWAGIVRRVVECAEKIEARGGRVVFVKFPTRGKVRELHDKAFPRAVYWEPLVAALRSVGVQVLDERDMPGVERLACSDGSHLDRAGAADFTRWIVAELTRRRLLE